ncbi:MAG: serine hydrolase [Chlamydiia bacterium]|nr:serine hydrolase [Chlamydiia bacterium]
MIKRALGFILLLQSLAFAAPVEELLSEFTREQKLSSLVVALYNGKTGRLLTYGNATEQTPYKLASITKVFTATALSLEILSGKLTLETPVTALLPNLKGLSSITLLQLATHTSGLPRTGPIQLRQTGRFLYSNLGYGLLGSMLSALEQKPYGALIRTLITEPLGMESTYTFDHPLPASGALISTGADMLRFLEANLGVKGPPKLISAMRFAQEGRLQVNPRLTMGLGWHRVGKFVEKNGALPGYSSYIGLIPEANIGIVLLTDRNKIPLAPLGRLLLNLMLNSENAED